MQIEMKVLCDSIKGVKRTLKLTELDLVNHSSLKRTDKRMRDDFNYYHRGAFIAKRIVKLKKILNDLALLRDMQFDQMRNKKEVGLADG